MSADGERAFLAAHSAHDAAWLHGRWRDVAGAVGAGVDVLTDAGGHDVLGIKTPALRAGGAGVYLCAGVHGDEPAGALGLLAWAEDNHDLLRSAPFLILPCFNPWGLVHNTRHDQAGRDLNRSFHLAEIPAIAAWRRYVEGCQISSALTLHEDYDARGCYLYEMADRHPPRGHDLLRAVADLIPPDPRPEIEGRAAAGGVIDTSERPRDLAGQPEALELHDRGVPWVVTFETPSEYSLFARMRVHRRVVDDVVAGSPVRS